jgi:hypothetical protein
MSRSDAFHFKRDVPELPPEAARSNQVSGLPLFVYEDPHRIGWSTRLRDLLSEPDADLSPDPLGFAEQLAGTLGRSPRTLFARIRRLHAAAPESRIESTDQSPGFLDALEAELLRRLAPGERPALLLGGGMYSGLLAAALQRAGRPFDVGSLRVPGAPEFAVAEKIAGACGARFVPVEWIPSEHEPLWRDGLPALDEPTAKPADLALHTVWARLRAEGASVVFSGQGGHATLEARAGLAPPAPSFDGVLPWLGPAARARLDPGAASPGQASAPRAQEALVATQRHWNSSAAPLSLPYAAPDLPWPHSRADLAGQASLHSPELWRGLPLMAAHSALPISARALLAPLQSRLQAARVALRGTSAASLLDEAALADLMGSHYAGQDAGRALANDLMWRAALLLLWWTEVLPELRRHRQEGPPESRAPGVALPQEATPGQTRLVVYTALIGAKESLANPLADLTPGATSDLDIDYVCVTDNPELRSPVWRMLRIPSGHVPAEKLSRRPKALPHEYFPDCQYSLYIDNTVSFRRLPQSSDLQTLQPYLFKAFRHATRSNPLEEAAAVAMLGYDDVGTICRQLGFYAASRPLASISPLTTATVLLRDHGRPEVQRFGTLWWESVLAFSKRDQLSFDFALQESRCEVEYFEGSTHENPFIHWNGSLGQHRVRASFDSLRYAWMHRDDPEAQRDPRAHFLAHPAEIDAAYQKPAPLLEYVCWQQGSSLGSEISPRRGLSGPLESLLAPHRAKGQTFLLLRIQGGDSPRAWEGTEHDKAAQALSMYLSPARGTLIDIASHELDKEGRVYVRPDPPCDLLIVLGVGRQQALATVQLIHRLARPDCGHIVMAMCETLPVRDAAALEEWLGAQYAGVTARSQLHASRHDDTTALLPNTLLSIQWQAAEVQAAA